MSTVAEVFLLDTNIISNLMKDGGGPVAERGRQAIEQGRVKLFCTSIVVQCELLFGLGKRPSPRLQAAYDIEISKLQVLPLDDSVAPHYAALRVHLERQGAPIGPNDALIAAHALALDAILVSADAEFRRVPGLRVENWYD